MGCRRGRRTRCLPRTGPADEGHSDGLAAQGPDVVNDHTDPDYDHGVLDRLAALHEEAAAFLDANAGGSPRLATYRERLSQRA